MPFDEEELDPHGECAAEIARLRAERDWLRWGLEEIGRCTEPRAGNNDRLTFGIVTEAMTGAGIGIGAAGIQKPQQPVSNR